jgi:16S rRNA (cytidine1402-2'-O)-methyltransferase
MKSGKLFLIPTLLAPETQHQVLPPYISDIVKDISLYFVENERTARRFISALKTGVVIENLQLMVLDKDTKKEMIVPFFDNILAGKNIGVISEAGCPGVADPGSVAVALAHEKNIEVVPLVGPSSILLGLMASGFNGQSFVFHGYLPIEKNERIQKLKELERAARQKNQTQIFIETPYRNQMVFVDIIEQCQGDVKLCVACEITSKQQFIKTMKVREWVKIPIDLHKKPTIFLIG